MLKYKINVMVQLYEKGLYRQKLRDQKIFGQGTIKKLAYNDPNINAETLEKLCSLLDLQPGDILEYVEDKKEEN